MRKKMELNKIKKPRTFAAIFSKEALRAAAGRVGGVRSGKRVFVAMSGGVDSSVAALLLKQKGYVVTGVFMKNWTEGCEWKEDRRDATRVCAKLEIPFLTFDFTREYRREVIDYMVKEYVRGRTPNPDVMCNKKIKFGWFLKRAREMGADYIATGHYVRIFRHMTKNSDKPKTQNPKPKNFTNYILAVARDLNKDQSYFLWTLTQKQLKYCLFPIGDYLKSETRKIAKEAGLPTAAKKDSQGLCFVGKVKFRDFLKDLLSTFDADADADNIQNSRPRNLYTNETIKNRRGIKTPTLSRSRQSLKKQNAETFGKILTTQGKILGRHEGLEFYTIGQRHGIGIGGGEPYFVAEKDIKNNVLVVAKKNDPAFYKKEIFVKSANWISAKPKFPLKCKARIRYRQPLQNCEVYDSNKKESLRVLFQKPVWAPAPGQSIVFYSRRQMLGGGIME